MMLICVKVIHKCTCPTHMCKCVFNTDVILSKNTHVILVCVRVIYECTCHMRMCGFEIFVICHILHVTYDMHNMLHTQMCESNV